MRSITVVACLQLLHPASAFITSRPSSLPTSSPTKCRSTNLFMTNDAASDHIPWPDKRPPPQGGDMAYVRDNITRQMDNYIKIRQAGWPEDECINDVYVRNPTLNSFWYVGKVARCTGTVSLQQAIARQFNLIEEHATRLRPIELGRAFGSCQVWVAPGDTEMEVSNNNPNIRLERMERYVEGRIPSEDVNSLEVGLNLEVVTNRGAGFFVERNDDGMVPPHLIQ